MQAAERRAGELVMLEDGSSVSLEVAIAQLDELVALEDPHSGDCVLRMLKEPFIMPEESAEIQSWHI